MVVQLHRQLCSTQPRSTNRDVSAICNPPLLGKRSAPDDRSRNMGLLHEWVTFEMASRGAGLEGCHHVEVVSEGVS